MINEAMPSSRGDESEQPSKKPPDWELPFSLPLLFFTSQFDITLQTYNYQFSEPFVHTEKPNCLRSKPSLLPKLKRNFSHVLQNAKHKVTKALHCWPCVRTEIETDSGTTNQEPENSESAAPPPSLSSPPPPPSADQTAEKQDRLRTISETVDSGISSLSDPQSSSSDQDVFSSSETEWEGHDVSSAWLSKTVSEGRCCFKEAKLLATHGLVQVEALRQSVALTRHQLQAALCQLWSVEMGLHDFRWEAVDRDSWTQHLLPTSSTFFGVHHLHPATSLSSLGFESELDYLWEWTLV